jgi:hypothetical protein
MRTIRDLREIINVSRLNYNNYDDDDDDQNLVPKPINSTKLPIKSNNHLNQQTTSSSSKEFSLLNRNSIPRLSSSNNKSIILDNDKTNRSISLTKSIVVSEFDFNANDVSIIEGNFDQMLTYIDASIVSEWLNRSNRHLNDMYSWLEASKCEAFIHFSNFWLTKINDKQRRDLINMEYSIIVEEISQAFLVGIESDKLTHKDVTNLLKAVFKEYPLALLSFRGLYLLLDYIDVLCSDRKDEYKKLLSDVKCRTLNKQYAQWLLSIRSFALINICSAVIKFYRDATAGLLFLC